MGRSKSIAFHLGVAALALSGGCLTEPRPKQAQAPDALVSDPHQAPSSALRSVSLRRASLSTNSASLNGVESEFVYIGLGPGKVPTGRTATIRNKRVDANVTVSLHGGGFDPVPIAAVAGDSVIIDVTQDNGQLVSFHRAVPITRRPTVVRTSPTRGKTAVPLNMSIRVVFSEPVDPATVTTSTIRLTQGRTTIPGTVRIVDGGLVAAFIPTRPLAPNTDHQIAITTGVLDLQGEALDDATIRTFKTGTTVLGPPASIGVSTDTVEITGLTYQLTARVEDADGNELTDQPIVWSVGDATGITVSQSGLVTALAEGEYDVFVSLGDMVAGIRVRVKSEDDLTSLTVSPAPGLVALEDTLLLTASPRDAAGRLLGRAVTWSSSDASIAVVEPSPDDGRVVMVIARRTGSVAITATSGGMSATSVVNVTAPRAIASVSFAQPSLDILASVPTLLIPTLRDANGREIFGRRLTWSSEDPSVATVDATGTVTGLKAGTTSLLARADQVSQTLAVTVNTLRFASVTAGGSHSCALTPGGAAYCWGWLGSSEGDLLNSTVPVPVAGNHTFASLTAGGFFVCGLTTDGRAYCWGINFGEVVNGSYTASAVPVAVSGGRTFTSLTAGFHHVCGLTADGAAYCWGENSWGQLGTGVAGPTGSAVPVAVTGGHTFVSLAAGVFHTCGLTSDGAAYCWGSQQLGALGNGTTTGISAAPVPVSGGHVFSSLSTSGLGEFHTCGVTTSGAAYCWGSNLWGQLGNPAGAGTQLPGAVPLPVSGGHVFAVVSSGNASTCGITVTAAAYCWGSNAEGHLGMGTGGSGPFNPFDFQAAPVPVLTAEAFSAVSTGYYHSCAMTTGGVAFCWGSGGSGQLGNGARTSSNKPVKVGGQP